MKQNAKEKLPSFKEAIHFLRNAPSFTAAVVFFLLFELVLGLTNDLYYLDGRGTFLTIFKKKIAEDSTRNYNVLLYGDSRSLALNGKKDTDYTMYNFSLPAAGPAYIQYFLKKYIVNHEKKPDVVVWAVDSTQLANDQGGLENINPEIWKNFRHRLLNLFSIKENLEQYEGKDKFFILKESLPGLLPSIEHREGLEKILTGIKAADIVTMDVGNLQENKRIAASVESSFGKINVGTYFTIPANVSADINIKSLQTQQKTRENTNYNLSPLLNFIEYAGKSGIKVVILEIPSADNLHQSRLNQTLQKEYELLAQKKDVYYIKYPEMGYDLQHFAEGIHYNLKGEIRLNREFDLFIWPEIKKIIKNER